MEERTAEIKRLWRRQALRLSRLQTALVSLALILFAAGVVGSVWAWSSRPAAPPRIDVPAGASGVVAADAALDAERQRQLEPAASWGEWASGKSVRLGVGFLGGFVAGFAARTYVKTVAVVAGVVTVLLAVASYFQLFNIDFSAVQTEWASSSQWLLAQSGKLKDVVIDHLPSTTAGLAGFVVGMMRR